MPGARRSDDLALHRSGRTDDDAPTLVLLHGLTDSGQCWADAVGRWALDYRIVAWDARGHGDSPRFTEADLTRGVGETHLDDLVDVLEQMEERGVTRPVLVGHSMGGGTAAALAATRPDLVSAVVLEDPALGSGRYLEVDAEEDAQRRLSEARATNADPAAAMRRGREDHPSWPEAEREPWLEAKLATDLGMLARPMITVRTPWREVTAWVAVPALVVTGGGAAIWTGPLLTSLRDVDNPLVTVEIVEGADHCVRRDRPDGFHEIVDPWLALMARHQGHWEPPRPW